MLTNSIFHPPTHSRTYSLFHPLAHVLIISLRTFFSLSCRWLIDSLSHSFSIHFLSQSSFSFTFRHSRIYFPILLFIQSLARLLASFFIHSPTPSFSLIFTVLFTHFPSHLCIDYLCIDLVSRLVSRTLTHVRLGGIILCINNSSLQTLTNRLTYSLVTCFFVQFLLRYLLFLFTRSARPFLICFVLNFYIFHLLYDPVKLRIANHSAAFCIHLWSFCVTVRDKLPYYMNINRYINQCDIGLVNVYLFRPNEWSVQIFLGLICTHM